MSFSDSLFGKPDTVDPWILDRTPLEGYLTCPAKAKFDLQYPPIVGEPAQVGTEIHRLIQEAFEWCKDDPESAPADFFEQEAPKCRPDLQPEVLRAAKTVSEDLRRINMSRIIGVEYQVDYQLPGLYKGRPAKITTAIDLLLQGATDTVLIVWDWKSGWKRRSNAEAQDSFQAQFIAFILFHLYPSVDTVHFFYKETRFGTVGYAKFERKALIGFSSMTTVQAMEARILQAVRYWSEDSKEAWPEPKKCSWCDHTARCPHVIGDVKDLASDEKGYVDQYYALKARIDKMEDAMIEVIKSGKKDRLFGSAMTVERKWPKPKFTLGGQKVDSKTNGESEKEDE